MASSAVYALIPITYLAVRGTHIISSSKIEPENCLLLYTLLFARAFGIFCCFCLISYHIPGSSWYTYHFVFKNQTGKSHTAVYVDVRSCFRHLLLFMLDFVLHTLQFVVCISFRRIKLNRKIAYCCIRWCSLVLLASSAVYALLSITYLAVRGIHIISSSKIKPENRVLLYTLMFARAFGIFCCLPGMLLFPSYTWQFVLYISFRLQKSNRKIAYCCICWCSLVLLASSAVYVFIPITYLAVRGIHIISSWKIKPENRVLLYTLMFARACGIFCCFCLISYHIPCSSWYTYHFIFKH